MLSILNVLAHGKNIFFKSSFAILLFLSVTLELFHLIIPNRSFEIGDLLANFFGVIFVAFYFILRNKNDEIKYFNNLLYNISKQYLFFFRKYHHW